MAADVIDAHLARCPDCAHFAEVATAEHRRLRVRPAGPVPDLSGEILERLAAMPVPGMAGGRRRRVPFSPRRDPLDPVAGGGPSPGGRRRWVGVGAAAAVAAAAAFGGGAALGDALGTTSVPHPAADSPPGHAASPAVGPTAHGSATRKIAGSVPPGVRYPGAIVTQAGVPKPAVVLTSTSGRPYNLAKATAGKVTLVYFGYTHCPDLCPINMALAASALRDLPASARSKIAVVFITTDPGRDTPSVIRRWLDRFSPHFVGLTGSLAAIHAAEVQAKIPLSYPAGGGQNYQVVHSGYTLVYSPDGRANLAVDDSCAPAQYATTLSHVLSYGFK